MRRTARKKNNQDGQALVEFAIVLPLLVLLVFGMIQFGILYKNQLALTDSVRVGARQAAVSREAADPTAAAVSAVRNAAADLEQSDLNISVTSSWVQGEDVTVLATYPYDISLFGFVVKSGSLTSETTERVE